MTHAPRRLAALLVLAASLTASLALGPAADAEVGLSTDTSQAVAGIEGEELPLPRTQFS